MIARIPIGDTHADVMAERQLTGGELVLVGEALQQIGRGAFRFHLKRGGIDIWCADESELGRVAELLERKP